MYDDEIPHEMFNRLKKLVNKVRALEFKKWTDRMLMERLMMAYKKITSYDVIERIMNHEMNIQEPNNIKNLYKGGVSISKKQDIALKATNKSKKKKAILESPSEEEEEEEDESEKEYDEEDMTLFIKKFNKFIKKRTPYRGDRREKAR
jgi:NACalpha-BTF3-like transcription factor